MWHERDESDDLLRFEEFIEKRRGGHWHWVGCASHIDCRRLLTSTLANEQARRRGRARQPRHLSGDH